MRQYIVGIAIPAQKIECGVTKINEVFFPIEGSTRRETHWKMKNRDNVWLSVEVGLKEAKDLEEIRARLHQNVDDIINAATEYTKDIDMPEKKNNCPNLKEGCFSDCLSKGCCIVEDWGKRTPVYDSDLKDVHKEIIQVSPLLDKIDNAKEPGEIEISR